MNSDGDVITFGPYRLDRASGRLVCEGVNLPLRPKTFAVLEYLAARPGRLVSQDELLDAVWPGTHVTPSALAGCIREVRRALGDDARSPRFVETAYRRGYRFVALGGASSSVGAPATASTTPRSRDVELARLARWFARAVARLATRAEHARHRHVERHPGGRPPRQSRRPDRRGGKRTAR